MEAQIEVNSNFIMTFSHLFNVFKYRRKEMSGTCLNQQLSISDMF